MDRMNYTPINGKFRPLNFSIEVMFDAADRFGSMANAFELLEKESREGVEALRWFLAHMANDAELVRRQEGYDRESMIEPEDIVIRRPYHYQIYKQAVSKALEIGYSREESDPDEEIDLGLMELNEKKGKTGD